jgi:hypothetical protein
MPITCAWSRAHGRLTCGSRTHSRDMHSTWIRSTAKVPSFRSRYGMPMSSSRRFCHPGRRRPVNNSTSRGVRNIAGLSPSDRARQDEFAAARPGASLHRCRVSRIFCFESEILTKNVPSFPRSSLRAISRYPARFGATAGHRCEAVAVAGGASLHEKLHAIRDARPLLSRILDGRERGGTSRRARQWHDEQLPPIELARNAQTAPISCSRTSVRIRQR